MSSGKKRKRDTSRQTKHKDQIRNGSGATKHAEHDLNTTKPSAVFTPQGGRRWTLSVALPGSIMANAQSHDLKTHLAGTLARALAVFCVDEVVIFDDGKEGAEAKKPPATEQTYTAVSHPSHFLSHILSLLETPPQLRKSLFPSHPNLRTAGTLPSLDMPHHPRSTERCEYREGVTLRTTDEGTYVDVGLSEEYFIPGEQIPHGIRVTLKLQSDDGDDDSKIQRQTHTVTNATAVNPAEPREAAGYYWGYTVRRSNSLSAVFTECPYDGGYDLSIGTSERGTPINQISFESSPSLESPTITETDTETNTNANTASKNIPKFHHLILTFGGVTGLETAAANDPDLARLGITKSNVKDLFDHWINVLPGQGSRTIRTEEAIWLGLMGTRFLVDERKKLGP